MVSELKELHHLRGLKARHIPYELTDGSWQQNPEHEEEVLLLEYFRHWEYGLIYKEGILFRDKNDILGEDRLDSFTIIK